jgi:hypothetical protein
MPGTGGQDVMGQYLSLVRAKTRQHATNTERGPPMSPLVPQQQHQLPLETQPITGKLAAAGFTLFLSQVLHPSPRKWREQLAAGIEWADARGGPGWVMGVSPPRPGFALANNTGSSPDAANAPANVAPLAMTVYSDMTALLAVLGAYNDNYNELTCVLAYSRAHFTLAR